MNSDIKYVLDGELYNHFLDFNIISSLVNSESYNAIEDNVIQFHMYDFIDLKNKDQEFPDRLDTFWHSIEDGSEFKYIRLVDQIKLDSEEDLMTLFAQHMSDGYEGTMVKSKDAYVFGKRSNTLLKYKEMITEEFLILDVVESEQDKLKPKIILQSKNENKDSFSTGTVKGNKEEVYETYFVNKDQVIGKWMTIQYQTLSPYGVPLFPVGIAIREGKEVDGEFVPEV